MIVHIGIHKTTAYCEEFGMAHTGASPDEAVKELTKKIRAKLIPGLIIKLPYLGQTFSPHWEDVKKPPIVVHNRHENDEFERAQRIAYKLNKDTL